MKEGLDARFQRHRKNAATLQAGLEALGFAYVVRNKNERLPMLHAVYLPGGAEEGKLRREIRSSYNIEIGGGLGRFKGKAWRVGLMGHSSTPDEVYGLLDAIGEAFKKHGIPTEAPLSS